jgi:hypothetical protein
MYVYMQSEAMNATHVVVLCNVLIMCKQSLALSGSYARCCIHGAADLSSHKHVEMASHNKQQKCKVTHYHILGQSNKLCVLCCVVLSSVTLDETVVILA